MTVLRQLPYPTAPRDSADAAAARLERGELLAWPECPWGLPTDDDRAFLEQQRLARPHKNIAYDPLNGRLRGYRYHGRADARRLADILADFSRRAEDWLGRWLPRYDAAWAVDRASFRPEEEATRVVRFTARNDLLHIDNYPTRPALGRRLLRVFVNLNRTEERVWVTSETWGEVFARFRCAHGGELPLHPDDGDWTRLRGSWWPFTKGTSDYDRLLQRVHHFMKGDEAFQDRSRKRYWHFPPGSAWLLFADGLAHAELRGQFALEQSFFVPTAALVSPESAPLASLQFSTLNRRHAA